MELFRVLNAKLIGPWRRAHRRRSDLRGLRSLDDRLLADIGVRRSDVEAVLYGQMPIDQLRRRDEPIVASAARRPAGEPDCDALDRAA
jgi:uncharacterized protein YjiS (DUF1127 family)